MARRSFIVPATVHANTHALTAWTARTGGSQITDLLDVSGAATATLVGTGADPLLFSGPADGTGALWLQLGELASAPRRKVTADDYPLADSSAAYMGLRRNTLGMIGNSIISNAGGPGLYTGSQTIRDSKGFWTWLNICLGQRLDLVVNAGKSGDTTAGMLARFDTDITPYAPRYVLMLEGTNDAGQNVSLATQKANWLALWAKAWAIGATVIQCTMPPRSWTGLTTQNRQDAQSLNRWLKEQGRNTNGLIIVDVADCIEDGAQTATWAPAAGVMQPDLVHPNSPGAAKMGLRLAKALDHEIPPTDLLTVGAAAASTDELLTNPNLFGTGAAVPAGWAISNAPAMSYVAASDGSNLPWFQFAPAAGSGADLTQNVNIGANLAIGDQVYFTVEAQADSLDAAPAANTQAMLATIQFWNGASFLSTRATDAYWDTTYVNVPAPFAGQSFRANPVFCTPPIVIPATTTLVQVLLSAKGGGTYRLRRASLRKGVPTG